MFTRKYGSSETLMSVALPLSDLSRHTKPGDPSASALISSSLAMNSASCGLSVGARSTAVTLLLYGIFKPVSRGLSLLAAVVSLVGCGIGPLGMVVRLPGQANNITLVIFGVYCLLIGYLILRSTFLPRAVGALMVFAGLGWLTFLSPALARDLYPYC